MKNLMMKIEELVDEGLDLSQVNISRVIIEIKKRTSLTA